MTELVAREARASDMAWIHATWIHSYVGQTGARKRASHFAGARRWIQSIVETRPRFVVLGSGPDGDTLHAWACAAPPNRLHYAYVPLALRGEGLGRRVIDVALGSVSPVLCSFRWPHGEHARFVFSRFEVPSPSTLRRQETGSERDDEAGGVVPRGDL